MPSKESLPLKKKRIMTKSVGPEISLVLFNMDLNDNLNKLQDKGIKIVDIKYACAADSRSGQYFGTTEKEHSAIIIYQQEMHV